MKGRSTLSWGRSIDWRRPGATMSLGNWSVRVGDAVSPARSANAVRVKSESALATSAGTFVAAPKHWGLEWVWPTRGWQTKAMSAHQGRIAMAWTPILRGLTVFSVYFYHSEGWTERNQQLLGLLGDEVRRCAGLWVIGGDFNMEPEAFGQFRHAGKAARDPGGARHSHLQTRSISQAL